MADAKVRLQGSLQAPRCLVLGANGLIGSHVARQLASRGCAVRAFDRFSGAGNLQGARGDIEKFTGNYLNASDVRNSLRGMQFIFHCIHTTTPRESLQKPLFDAETNILPAVNLLGEAVKAGVGKIIYFSSLAVYGSGPRGMAVKENDKLMPISPYGVSKFTIEKCIEYFGGIHGIDYAILRPATTYAEKQSVLPGTGVAGNFISNALAKKPVVIYGDGKAVRDIVHAEDIARGAVEAAFKKHASKVFNLGTGRGVTLNQLAKMVGGITGSELRITRLPGRNEVQRLVCDISRAKRELGWSPRITLEEGLRRCVEAFSG